MGEGVGEAVGGKLGWEVGERVGGREGRAVGTPLGEGLGGEVTQDKYSAIVLLIRVTAGARNGPVTTSEKRNVISPVFMLRS